HFGARAPVLGKILAGVVIDEEEEEFLKKDKEDPVELGALSKLEPINADIKLHLSGTPYRILMGSEFTQEDIIAFVQFSDIYEAKLRWSAEHLDETEWANPYYGFPQMIRFAFNPNESSRQRLADIPGSKPAELFTPASISKSGDYTTFKYEQEVIDLLQVLDGSKNDTNMLGLLDNETVKAGKLAQHIVVVLPYRASCDALETLIKKNKKRFKNISEYKLLNISGYDQAHSTPEEVKSVIAKTAQIGEKTITLTVNRMLTGTTVPQWDTMIYLKGTTSPQEYDQAIFRLQSAWIEKYKDEKGDVIKYDMKPQTLLVDLDPTRLFYLQEMKAFTYGANTQYVGNENIEKSIERELRISPIITLNAEQNKLVEVTATVIIDHVRKYASERTITEDVQDIGIDASLKKNPAIFELISKLAELGGKNGLNILPNKEEGEEIDLPEPDSDTGGTDSSSTGTDEVDGAGTEDISSFERRFRTYYVMILLFAFLSKTIEKTLTDVINNIDANEDNSRIARNLGLKKSDLLLIRDLINPFVRSALDYKIQNADYRSFDATVSPVEHIDIAINKFGRLSAAEIFTPPAIVSRMYDSFDQEFWKNAKTAKILDLASKSGSFAKGFVEKAMKQGVRIEDIQDNFYSIPTSPTAYEFTRKMYEALGLNINNIAMHFTSFDLVKLKDKEVQALLLQDKPFSDIRLGDLKEPARMSLKSNKDNMKFTAIVGNPPYQQRDGGAQASARPIYNLFVEMAKKLDPGNISMIMPTRWYSGGKGLDDFRDQMLNDIHISELHDFLKPELVFKNINLRGGICYFFWVKDFDNAKNLTKVFTYENSLNPNVNIRSLKTQGSNIVIRHSQAIEILKKVKSHPTFQSFENHISALRPFGFRGYFTKNKQFRSSKDGLKDPVICYGKGKKIGYLERSEIAKNPAWIDKYKVFTPRANNIGTELNDDNLNTFIGHPKTICTESYVVVGADLKLGKKTSRNLSKYFTTKFTRFQHSVGKASQDATSKTYKFVPLQNFTEKSDIDWSKSIADIDKQLYRKYGLDKREIDFIETHIKAMH
ncbi:MAG: Eco57I restriction endonuclease, partial [Parcubacteria group bacterium Athens0416_74]